MIQITTFHLGPSYYLLWENRKKVVIIQGFRSKNKRDTEIKRWPMKKEETESPPFLLKL